MKQNRKKDKKRIEANLQLISEVKFKEKLLSCIRGKDGLTTVVAERAVDEINVIKRSYQFEKDDILHANNFRVLKKTTFVDVSNGERTILCEEFSEPTKKEIKQICKNLKHRLYLRHVYATRNGEPCLVTTF